MFLPRLFLLLLPPLAHATTWHVVKDYDGKHLLHGKTHLSNTSLRPLNYYNRLPAQSENTTRPSIWGLQQQPAGMFVQFQSNSSAIQIQYTLGRSTLGMWHFPPTGVSGMDAYAYDDANNTWRWTGTAHPSYPTTLATVASLRCTPPHCPTKTYRIHLCTYNEVKDDFALGTSSPFDTFVPDASHFHPIDQASIVWYGSSILQGAVASRPGQIMTHQVSRTLETLIYNFGFSGNCLMETSVAQYLVQIVPKPTLFVIDCNPNMNYTLVQLRAVPLIQFIRNNGHPTTPIIMTEGTKHGGDWYDLDSRVGRFNKSVVLKHAFDELVQQGDQHLYYSTNKDIYTASLGMKPSVSGDGRFLVDPTVGGTHPTDLGMRKQASYWETQIPLVMAEDARKKKKKGAGASLVPAAGPTLVEAPAATLKTVHALRQDEWWPDNVRGMHAVDTQNKMDISTWAFTDGSEILHGFSTFTTTNGTVLGRNSPYNRLPSVAQADVRGKVWSLSEMSTGLYLKFTTNATDIAINHTLAYASQSLWHMPFSGTDGLDVYAWSEVDASWRHVPVGTGVELFAGDGTNMSGVFHRPEPVNASATDSTHWTYLVYLPLRNAPNTLSVGVPMEYSLCSHNCVHDVAPNFNAKHKPILWYGTSIQQGGVASRAGNEYDAIISRALAVDIHNFGFAGNGVMEISVAKYLAMADASLIVIDCLPNMGGPSVSARTIPLVHYLRNSTKHRNTPIVLAEGTPYPAEWLDGPPFADAAKNKALRNAYNTLLTSGVQNLHYVEGKDLFKNPLVNPTVGGVHSSDLGQYEIADYYVGYLPTVL